jgi:hypothetical protein
MSLSPEAIPYAASVGQRSIKQTYLAFPLILVSVALVLILISALFSPVTLETGRRKSSGRSVNLCDMGPVQVVGGLISAPPPAVDRGVLNPEDAAE